jgi:ubiquinone biosynthesis protein
MVMEEGVATFLDPDINMWESAEPFLRDWIRSELGPEAALADRLVRFKRTLEKLPDLVDRVDHYFPAPGGAPPELPQVQVDVKQLPRPAWRDVAVAVVAALAGAAGVLLLS